MPNKRKRTLNKRRKAKFTAHPFKLEKKKDKDLGTFHYDRSLRLGNMLATDDLATRFVVKRWH